MPPSVPRRSMRTRIAVLLLIMVLVCAGLASCSSVPAAGGNKPVPTYDSPDAVLTMLEENKALLTRAADLMLTQPQVFRVDAGALGYVAVDSPQDFQATGSFTPEEMQMITQAFAVSNPMYVDHRGGLLLYLRVKENPRISGNCILIYLPDPDNAETRREAVTHPVTPNMLQETDDPHWLMMICRPRYEAETRYSAQELSALFDAKKAAFVSVSQLYLTCTGDSLLRNPYGLTSPYAVYDDVTLTASQRSMLLDFWLENSIVQIAPLCNDQDARIGVEFLFRVPNTPAFARISYMAEKHAAPGSNVQPLGTDGWYLQTPQ